MEKLYLFFIGIGLSANLLINYYQLKRESIKTKDNIFINIIYILTFVVGSKILDFFVNYEFYLDYRLIEYIQYGYMFYGGVILSISSLAIYCKIKKINLENIFKHIIPNILLLYTFGKIGCFFNKCCMGIHDFPIQLIESTVCFVAYGIILKKMKTLNKVYICCIFFGIIRSLSFLLRNDISTSNFIVNEVISVCIFLIGFIKIINYKKPTKNL